MLIAPKTGFRRLFLDIAPLLIKDGIVFARNFNDPTSLLRLNPRNPIHKKTVHEVMKQLNTQRFTLLSVSFLLLAILSTPVLAQDTETRIKEGQEYKMKYNEALEAAKAKDYNAAYTAFEEAIPLAEQAGASDIVQRSSKVLAQIDNMRGTAAFKAERYEEAITHHDKGIERYAEYIPNMYGKAKALEKLERMDEALPVFSAVLASSDRKSANAAEKALRGYYIYKASSVLGNSSNPSASEGDQALAHLAQLEEYVDGDSDSFYYKALAYQAKGDYASTLENASQALELHRGSRTDKAKIYFTIGEASMFSGNNQEARDAFSNALFGSYKPLAEHYLEELSSPN